MKLSLSDLILFQWHNFNKRKRVMLQCLNEHHLTMLLSLSWLTSKLNPYSTWSWTMSARKGQNLCQVQTQKCPHTISYLFDYRRKAEGSGHLFSQSIVQGAWVHPLATMINSFSASLSAVTNVATIVPRQNAILGQKVPHWTPFSKTCSLTTCISLVFELTATKGFKKLIKDRKLLSFKTDPVCFTD